MRGRQRGGETKAVTGGHIPEGLTGHCKDSSGSYCEKEVVSQEGSEQGRDMSDSGLRICVANRL